MYYNVAIATALNLHTRKCYTHPFGIVTQMCGLCALEIYILKLRSSEWACIASLKSHVDLQAMKHKQIDVDCESDKPIERNPNLFTTSIVI